MSTDTRAEVVVYGDDALISLHGELDLFSLHVLEEALRDADEVSRVVIDLQAVEFLDCAALRRIERAAAASAVEGRVLRVEHASGMVRRLLEILKLDDLTVC
jgi:anti-anti-sigma factor